MDPQTALVELLRAMSDFHNADKYDMLDIRDDIEERLTNLAQWVRKMGAIPRVQWVENRGGDKQCVFAVDKR